MGQAHAALTVRQSRSFGPALAAIVVSAVYSAYIAFPAVFTGSATYDDEGYVLASFRSWIDQGGLYGETYSQYGPGYYSVVGTLFRVLDVDLMSLGPGRVTTLVLVVLAASAAAAAVWRATSSVLTAVAAQLFVLHLLRASVGEPLHPGTFLVALLALFAASLFWPRRGVAAAVAGACIGLMLTTKVNVGALALVGCVAALAPSSGSPRVRRVAPMLLVAVPVGLVGGDLGDPQMRAIGLVVLLGAAVAYVVVADDAAGPDRRLVATFAAAMIGTAAVSCLPVLATGTSLADLLDGAVFAPTQQRDAFAIAYPIDAGLAGIASLHAVVVVLGALVAARIAAEPAATTIVAAAKLTAGAAAIAGLSFSIAGSLAQVLVLTACAAIPLAGWSAEEVMARRVLVVVAVLQPLHAYPVAGSQIVWGSFLTAVVAFVNVGDGVVALRALARSRMGRRGRPLAVAAAAAGALLVFSVAAGHRLWPAAAYEAYRALPETRLEGAGRVRLGPEQAAVYGDVVALLESTCDSFYSLPGMHSFHVFSGLEPATGVNATAWPALFDRETQQTAVRDLQAFPGRLCLLRNDVQLASWQQRRPLRRGPLLGFLDAFSQEVGRAGDYVVLRRPG